MSEAERRKWNARYAAGAYSDRHHPTRLLVDWIQHVPRGPALDVACGAGRNSIYLAKMGFRVDALDISEVALKRVCAAAREAQADITCVATDLDLPNPTIPAGPYSLIVLVRYVNLAIYPALIERLIPGGYLVTEQHLQTSKRVIGPRTPEFRLAPCDLRNACAALESLYAFEGLVTDPDGRVAALAQFVGRKRDPGFDTRGAKTA